MFLLLDSDIPEKTITNIPTNSLLVGVIIVAVIIALAIILVMRSLKNKKDTSQANKDE